MDTVGIAGVFGIYGFYLMTQFGHSARHIFQRFPRVQPDIEHIAIAHAFYAQFYPHQGKWADISRYI